MKNLYEKVIIKNIWRIEYEAIYFFEKEIIITKYQMEARCQ